MKLVGVAGKGPIATIFVHGGNEAKVFVPGGIYELRYASGVVWYGTQYLFGPKTVFAKADETLYFTPGNGYSLMLHKVTNGNLETHPIRAEDF